MRRILDCVTPSFVRSAPIALAIAGTALAAMPAAAQDGGAQAALTDAELLRDYIHFIKINRDEAADIYARTILARGLDAASFVDLVESSGELARFEEAIGLAVRNVDLEESAGALAKLFEAGKLSRARDPEQIAEAIELLSGTARSRLIAKERLVAAGEYAMPQLVETMLLGDPAISAEVTRIMQDLGTQAVTPLWTALPSLRAADQEKVIDILGLLPSTSSLPMIREVAEASDNDAVRRAAGRAYQRLGVTTADASASDWWLDLGEAYYDERPEVTSFPAEQFQLLWSFDPGLGLNMTAIETPVYHEAMAMRAAERALGLDSSSSRALALWVSSNFSREIDTPAEYVNPAYSDERRDAMYYAVASGTNVAQRVLARGIDNRDTPLVRRAIRAITQTAGGAALAAGPAGRGPLVEALTYPNRRVQIEAALAFGTAQPYQGFERSERVVPILAGAVRNASDRYAAVLTADAETYQIVRGVLESEGYQVLPRGTNLGELAPAIAQTPAVDLVVSMLTAESTIDLLANARADAKLSATPVLAMVSGRDYTRLRRVYDRDSLVAVRPSGVSEEQIKTAAAQLMEQASGGVITSAEAQDYAGRSLNVLRDLAIARNPVFEVADAATTLIGALGEARGARKLRIADILSRIELQRAQVSLMDAALATSGPERLALLEVTADSAKRFGSLLEAQQVAALQNLARSDDSALATAAAALMGSLGLPNDEIVPLILDEG